MRTHSQWQTCMRVQWRRTAASLAAAQLRDEGRSTVGTARSMGLKAQAGACAHMPSPVHILTCRPPLPLCHKPRPQRPAHGRGRRLRPRRHRRFAAPLLYQRQIERAQQPLGRAASMLLSAPARISRCAYAERLRERTSARSRSCEVAAAVLIECSNTSAAPRRCAAACGARSCRGRPPVW